MDADPNGTRVGARPFFGLIVACEVLADYGNLVISRESGGDHHTGNTKIKLAYIRTVGDITVYVAIRKNVYPAPRIVIFVILGCVERIPE